MIQRQVYVRIECDGFKTDNVEVHELTGVEAISRLFELDVAVICREPDGLDAEDLLTRKVTLILEDRGQADEAPIELRRIHGIIAEVRDLLSSEAYSTYRLRIVPRFWLTSLVETLDIFLDKSIEDILRDKLTALNLVEKEDFELWLIDKYPAREFVVQYKETDFAFLSRLMEHVGISYYFEHKNGRDVVVFCDSNQCFGTVPGDAPIPFSPRGERVDVFRLEVASRIVPRVYIQRDYNYRNPGVDLTASAELSGETSSAVAGGIVEYGGHFKNEEEGRWLAEIRAQERNAERRVFQGSSDAAQIGAGIKFTLTGHPRGDLRFLLTEVRHHVKQTVLLAGGGASGDASGYANEFHAVMESTAFRPQRVTPKPRVSGVLTAIVDAALKGQYAELDDQGRYRVKFMFDTSGADGGKASRLVRMMQPHAGAGYGMHFPLRPGIEVLITFLDGDPDRPIIAGTVPNPQTGSPVVADNATKNIIRTGGGNEIAIDDAEDSHRIKMMTPTSSTTFQLGAPNDPEKGAMLSTLGASTTVATTGISAAGAFKSTISLITDYSSSGDITTIAKKPGPEALFTLVVSVIDSLVTAVTTTISAIEAGMAATEKGASQEATKASEKATAAQAACKTCRDAASALLPASKQSAIDAMLQNCTKCTGASHPSPQAGMTCSLTAAQQASLAQMQSYEAKRAAAVAYSTKMGEADALHDAVLDKRYWVNYYVALTATQTEDMHNTTGSNSKATTDKEFEAARTAYKTSYDAAAAELTKAKAPYAGGTEFNEYDKKMAECAADSCCGGVDALRTTANDKNKSFNDLVTAHGPHKDACKEAKTGLAVWSVVPPLFSAAMFVYTKLKKTQKAVEALALWGTAETAMGASLQRPVTAATAFHVTPASPQHVVGANSSMHVYGVNDMLVSGEKTVILGAGVMADPTGTAQIPNPLKGRVGIIGMEEVRIASKGEIEVAATTKVQISSGVVDALADTDMKLTAKTHTIAAKGGPRAGTTDLAKLLLSADLVTSLGTAELSTDGGQSVKVEQKTPANTSTITSTTPGDFKVDAGAKTTVEAQTEIKLSIKNNGPSLTMDANGISLKVGPSAEIIVKADQVMLKLGNSIVCKLTQDKAALIWGTAQVSLSASGADVKGTRVSES